MTDAAAYGLTPATYPHIWEAIVWHAGADVLLSLRATCKDLHDSVDKVLLYHIAAVGSAHSGGTRDVFGMGYVLSCARQGMVPVRVPAAISKQALTMKRHCHIVDLERFLSMPAQRYVSRLVTPNVVRIMPTYLLPRDQSVDITLGAKTVVMFPLLVMLSPIAPENKIVSGVNASRLVIHQHVERSRLCHIKPMRPLRQLVLIFYPARKPEERQLLKEFDPRDLREPPEDALKWYLNRLLSKVSSKVTITVVGLENVCKDLPAVEVHIQSTHPSVSGRVEFRTRSNHRTALSQQSWGLEMVGAGKRPRPTVQAPATLPHVARVRNGSTALPPYS